MGNSTNEDIEKHVDMQPDSTTVMKDPNDYHQQDPKHVNNAVEQTSDDNSCEGASKKNQLQSKVLEVTPKVQKKRPMQAYYTPVGRLIQPNELSFEQIKDEMNVCINNCESVSELWGIEVDKGNFDKMMELTDLMNMFYARNINLKALKVKAVCPGSYYAFLQEWWHRVKCLECHNSMATILLIDEGFTITVDISNLLRLDNQFCSLPSQAYRISLTGLEVFKGVDEIKPILEQILLRKNVIVRKEAPIKGGISAKLFQKSENGLVIDINQLLLAQILQSFKVQIKTPETQVTVNTYPLSFLKAPKVPKEDYFEGQVILSSDPYHFVIQLLSDKNSTFNEMVYKLSETCRSYKGLKLTSESIKVGYLYACKFSKTNNNTEWCRVYVSKIINNYIVCVYFCDYGNYKNVNICDMIPLSFDYCQVPYRALWAELSGVRPPDKEHQIWHLEACLYFQKLMKAKKFICKLVRKRSTKMNHPQNITTPVHVKDIYTLQLIDAYESTDISDMLIKSGWAEKC